MQKLLVICGPTGTGKTALGIHLAKKFDGEIVSADSRQVYKGLDIVTGKDIPENSNFQFSILKGRKRIGYWKLTDDTKLWLVDVVEPTEKFSVAAYQQLATLVIDDIWQRGSLPIMVGGTGLYIKAMIDGIDTLGVPPNPALRISYNRKTTEELYDTLFRLDPGAAAALNASEIKNRQRLIRKIEIAQAGKNAVRTGNSRDSQTSQPSQTWRHSQRRDVLLVGLTVPYQVLRERIERRIDQWVVGGAEDEVAGLLQRGLSWDSQAMSSIGYRQWKPYFEKTKTKEEVIKKWKKEEWQYAKRQMTWFKKDKRIKWFDIGHDDWREQVDKLVGSWYDS